MDDLSRIEALLDQSITSSVNLNKDKKDADLIGDGSGRSAARPKAEKAAPSHSAPRPAPKAKAAKEPKPVKEKPVKAPKEKKPRKKASVFGIVMLLYIILFVGAAAYGVNVFWQFMEAYEQSRPETFMNAYMAEMTDEKWHDLLLENSVISVTAFEDSTAVFEQFYGSSLSGGNYSYSKKVGQYSDQAPVYSLRSGGTEIAVIGLAPDGDGKAGFGLDLWQISFVEPSINNAGSINSAGVQIDVPAGCSVTLDGIVLDDSYITDSHLDYDDLTEIEQRIEGREHMVRYQVDGIYLNATVTVDGYGELEPYLVENGRYYYRAVPTQRYSVSILTYSDMTVTLNGAVLTTDDAQVSSWEAFEEFASYIPDLPKICRYEISGLYTQPEVTVTDMHGAVLEGVADENGTMVYEYPFDEELEAEQKQFVEDFLQKYVNFACGDYNARYGLHSALTEYVLEGTVLKYYFFKSVSGGGDGGGMLGVTVHQLWAGDFIRLRDNCYICTGILDATERRYDRDQEFYAEYMIIAIMSQGQWYIAAMPTV